MYRMTHMHHVIQMVLTIKLSSFAYNVWDGRKWAEIENDTGDKRRDRYACYTRALWMKGHLPPCVYQ